MPPMVWFPEGRVASKAVAFSPTTQGPPPMHGPPNVQQFTTMPDPPRPSTEQGIGRSPGQRWPHMPKVQQFNYDALSNMAWHPGEVVRVERQGWSAPTYYEQAPGEHFDWQVPIAVAEQPQHVYTGLNYIGGIQ